MVIKYNQVFSKIKTKTYLENIPFYFILILFPVIHNIDYITTDITSIFLCTSLLILFGSFLFIPRNNYSIHLPDLCFILFAVWYAIRTIFTVYPPDPVRVAASAAIVLLYIYCRNTSLKDHFFFLLFLAGIVQCVWYILQLCEVLPSYHPILKGTGCFFNPAILGIFLVSASLAGLYIYYKESKPSVKILLGGGLGLLLFCIILLNSRASWLALSAGVSWILITAGKPGVVSSIFIKPVGKHHRLLKYSLLLIGTGLIALFAASGLYLLRPESVHGRILIWQVTCDLFLKAP